jgi:hypothetical protein
VTFRAARAVALVAVLCAGLAACGDGASSGSTGASRSTTSSTSTTTSAPATSRASGPTSTVPPSGGTVLTVDDSVLAPPADARPVRVDGGDPCAVLARGPRSTCGTAGAIAWVIAPGTTDVSPVRVYRVDHDTATPTLAVQPGAREDYDAVRVAAADLDGEPGEELVIGLRNTGTGALLELEVVGDDGAVLAHDTLDRGRAALGPGVLRTWTARYLADDPNCCPSSYEEAVVGLGGGRWRSVPERQVPAAAVPDGDF